VEFVITPSDRPDWEITPDMLRQALLTRWPEAAFFTVEPDMPMILEAQVDLPEGRVGVTLLRDGAAMTLDAGDRSQ
jgi:hypothetical protein